MTRTILLADDSVTIQKVVELTFMDEDFRVVSVGNGSDAIDQLQEIRPDFVIADVHMPGADGYEVSQRTREALPATPVLLLVGTFESFDAERAAQVGASGHLKKPFDSQELLRRVRELLSGPQPALPMAEPRSAAPMPAPMPMAEEEQVVALEEALWTPEPLEPAPAATWRAPEPAPPALGDWSLEAPPAATEWQATPEPVAAPEPEPYFREPEPVAEPEPYFREPEPLAPLSQPAVSQPAAFAGELSEADVDRIARRVIELLGDKVVRDVAWEVVPDLAEVILKARIRELEASVE
jgi:CheY-like chemotaxis protein